MNSQTSTLSQDDINRLNSLLSLISSTPELEQIAAEIGVLQSIYGEDSVRAWDGSTSDSLPDSTVEDSHHNRPIRYEIHVSLPPPYDLTEDTSIRVLVSLPRTYPAASPPQLQLLSRYIGPHGVDAGIFGSVLRIFMSKGGINWIPDNVCVFDGMESVRELCARWYTERLTDEKANDSHDGESFDTHNVLPRLEDKIKEYVAEFTESTLPSGIHIVEAEPIIDRKSAFVGRACRITDPSQVSLVLTHLLSNRRISRAAHPIINAWRCRVGGLLHQDSDDDGETAAGGRLAHLLQILDVDNVLVVVTRYFGGIHLGPDRFKHINQAARNALELGGFLDTSEASKQSTRHKRKV